ncbi:MAG: NAD(P)/FAD-dependent oxidoreductase [Acidimicrobiales bacterium]
MTITGDRPNDVVVVGAGLAGLAAAVTLHEAGRRVLVVEADDAVGGRVRTDVVDGFRLDRGFQVLLTDYPELRRLDTDALDLRRFSPGALVRAGGRFHRVGDPRRDPRALPATVLAPIGSPLDKLRLLRLQRRVLAADAPDLLRGPDLSTAEHLRRQGFSPRMVDRFFRPLFGGIQLDTTLATSSRMFDVILRALLRGDSAVPAAGMQALPDTLAARVPADALLLGEQVASVDATGVSTTRGRRLDATHVVVATEAPAAADLLAPFGFEVPPPGRTVAGVYFAAETAPRPEPLVILDGDGTGPATNVSVMTNVAPEYSSDGRALVSVACVGDLGDDLEPRVLAQLSEWFGPEVDRWEHLRTYRITHGQPDQRPPFSPRRAVRLAPTVWVCGDHRDTGSSQGALFSGRRTAEAILAASDV